MTYEELNIVFKFCYNQINYDLFETALKEVVPYTTSEYIDEKWTQWNRDQMGFLATYDKKFYNFVMNQIETTNYKG